MTKIYVVRHGETDWNATRRVQGRTDIKLNENGIRQAKELAKLTAKLPIDVCISSPLARAAETAKIIFDGDVIFDDRLAERHFGAREGVVGVTGEWHGMWNMNMVVDETCETTAAAVARAKGLLDEIKTKYAGKNVLLVTHGGMILCIRAYFDGIPASGDLWEFPRVGNCEILSYELKG